MLTQTALERVFNLDDPNNELINEVGNTPSSFMFVV